MKLNVNDWIGFIGVTILLIAFLMNLLNKMDKNSLSYILLNIIGAGLACLASLLINYMPFVILEGTWTVVSIIALINYAKKTTVNHR
ncbi:MAG: hypothetical protein IPJ81_13660 [Chitinophagaceae bacterium]|nr:hypothetical protein [Chitinophagaceae bacterium]